MGDKSRKRRPGREAWRDRDKPRWVRVDGPAGFYCWVDTVSGEIKCWCEGSLVPRDKRDRITAAVIQILGDHDMVVVDPLQIRDFLFT